MTNSSRRRAVHDLYQQAQREAELRLLSTFVDGNNFDYVGIWTEVGHSRWVQDPPGSGKWRGLPPPYLREQ
jgi:hypothetical protein